MPADRFLHPRLGHSDKINLLTDLQFRVWVQYQLSSDDFGVMRRSAVTLQADNDRLASRPRKIIDECMNKVIEVGLLQDFTHQGRIYVCQRDWQSFQKIEYPRPTFEPKPPPELLRTFDALTQDLFLKHPGGSAGKKLPKGSRPLLEDSTKVPQSVSESSPKVFLPDPDYARERTRETAKANGLRLTADGSEGVQGKPIAMSLPPTANSKRPIFEGQRFVVFEWQLSALMKLLGSVILEQFDLHAWFFDLDEQMSKTGAAVPQRDNGEWLQAQTLAEARRRGFPVSEAPQAGKQTSRLAAAIANIRAEAK